MLWRRRTSCTVGWCWCLLWRRRTSCTVGCCVAVAEKNFCTVGWCFAVALPAVRVTAYNGMMIPARTTSAACTCLCVARLTEWGSLTPNVITTIFPKEGCAVPACWRPPCECPCALHQPPWLRSPPPCTTQGVGSNLKTQEEKYVRTLSCGPG